MAFLKSDIQVIDSKGRAVDADVFEYPNLYDPAGIHRVTIRLKEPLPMFEPQYLPVKPPQLANELGDLRWMMICMIHSNLSLRAGPEYIVRYLKVAGATDEEIKQLEEIKDIKV